MAKPYGAIEVTEMGVAVESADFVYVYGGHRNLLAAPTWQLPQDEQARRLRFSVVPWLTVPAGSQLTIRLVRLDGEATPDTDYLGPIASSAGATLGPALVSSPPGFAINGCDQPAPGLFQVLGTDWELRAWLSIDAGGPAYIHGVRLYQVHDELYNAPTLAAECDRAEITDRALATSQAQPYDFVDSWGGQSCLAHTLDRFTYESGNDIVVPFYSYEVVP